MRVRAVRDMRGVRGMERVTDDSTVFALADNYDKEAHDRLLAKAHQFCASVANKYGSSTPSTAGASSASSVPAPVALPPVECTRSDEPAADGHASYTATIEAHAALYQGALLTATAPHGVGAVQFKAPGATAFSLRAFVINYCDGHLAGL